MTAALASGDPDGVVRAADDGAKHDAEHNGGKRLNDYALRKVALYAKRGDFDAVEREFDAMLDRAPDDGNLYVKAAETMLSAKQGPRAAKYAERGMAKGNRDLAAACRELLEAAKRYA
ncbi:MAG: hypothetical protein JNK93_17910 [Planctomycetia bacterium]|nr:hypothetical protein [Planctomycetia bacterium]